MTHRRVGMALKLARAQGAYNLVTGVWPLVSMRSFEALLGPKVDRWLVKTVSGLLIGTGLTQVGAEPGSLRAVRQLSVTTGAALFTIDCTYALRGRIAKTYLIDAVVEAGFIVAWLGAARRESS